MFKDSNYRHDVDGLRALAVALVVFCHAGWRVFKGGFIGVDVFFVISGFVVTRSISAAQESGRFRFRDFYIRRAKRLAPALFAMMAATFIFSILFLIPDDAMEVAKNIAYASVFASNIYLAKATGYFAPSADQQPLLHTWSLSVEEQFYLVFPVVLFALRHASRKVRISVLLAIGASSLAWAQMAVQAETQGAYYFSQYRACEFVIGAVLALLSAPNLRRTGREVLVVVGICGIVGSAMWLGDSPYPGLWSVVPTSFAALVIFSGQHSRIAHAVFGNKLALWLGTRSYGIYLWHWPILFAFRRFGYTSTSDIVLAVAVSILLAAASFRCIEQPLRHAKISLRKAAIAYVVAPIAVVGIVVAVGRMSTNFLFLYPEQFQRTYAESTDHDWIGGRGASCWDKIGVTNEATCSVGAAQGEKAVLWGDSHAYQFVYFFRELGNEFGLTIHDMARPLCPPLASPPIGSRKGMDIPCRQHDKLVMEYLLRDKRVTTVFLAGTWTAYASAPPSGTSERGFSAGQFNDDLYATAKRLVDAGKRVVILDDVPPVPEELTNCPLYNRLRWAPEGRPCVFPRASAAGVEVINKSVVETLTARLPEVAVIHTYGAACDDAICHTSARHAPLYRNNDTTHLSLAGGANYYQLYRSKAPGELEEVLRRTPSIVAGNAPRQRQESSPQPETRL